MVQDAGSRLLVARRNLHDVRIAPDADAPAARALVDGEARLTIDRFALTANNITYAAFGDAMQYWQFFPTGDDAWGCVPVWGFATVTESRATGVAVGERVYGYLPMGTHLVVRPAQAKASGFIDAAPHRQALAAVYNQYVFCAADPAYLPEREGHQAVLKPLFTTAFLIDDFFAEQGFCGATQMLLSSASSKTAYATAFCLSSRTARPRIVGLTSPSNLAFARSLGCYDQVVTYDAIGGLDGGERTVYIDFAGSTPVRRAVHERFDERLAYSCAVGGTHWTALGGAGRLPGPKPELFFAPAQIRKLRSPPPDGWGADGLQLRLGEAWQRFVDRVDGANPPWLTIRSQRGAVAVEAAYRQMLDGKADAREGLMLAL